MSLATDNNSANADRGHAFSVGRQYAGQQPFSHQNGPMTAHHFGLLPDPTQSCRNGFLIAACEPKPGFSNRTATKRPLASSPDTSGMMLDDRVLLPFLVGKYVYWSEIAVRKWHERLFAAQESWEMH